MKDISFSDLFHQTSKIHKPVSLDDREWPEEWKTTRHNYKDYDRFPKIDLGSPALHINNLCDSITKRTSRRDLAKTLITKQELSSLLKYSCGTTGRADADHTYRTYPSAGSRFPIETYLLVLNADDKLQTGVYHYKIKTHQLDILWQRHFSDKDLFTLFLDPWFKNATVVIVLTAVVKRMQNKYGERGYRYTLLEAGHIGQNIALVAQALNLKCCPLANTRDEELEQLLDVDGSVESVVYAFAVGK